MSGDEWVGKDLVAGDSLPRIRRKYPGYEVLSGLRTRFVVSETGEESVRVRQLADVLG